MVCRGLLEPAGARHVHATHERIEMLITHAPKRCSRCENILSPEELEHKWCDKCRDKKRDENNRHKKNQESRDNIAAMFGYNRKEKREDR